MNKYVLEPRLPNFFHAGSKAREDINFFLGNNGYEVITFKVNDSKKFTMKVKNYISCLIHLDDIVDKVEPGSMVLLQYPYPCRSIVYNALYKKIRKKGSKVVALVHDLDTLRFEKPDKEIRHEIDNLSSFDQVISHNPIMTEWLKEKGLKKNIIELEVFDYRMNEIEQSIKSSEPLNNGRVIVFAGNLSPNKSKFLYEFNDETLKGLNMNLYGIEYDEKGINCKSMAYKGVFHPEELPCKMEGDFGLVWDGEGIDTCSGHFGQYLRFNNPHKLSLYIAAGIPVITWKKAAISNLIDRNKIGVLVDSLTEVGEAIAEIDDNRYLEMKNNVQEFKHKVTNGHYIQNAIKRIEESLTKEKENEL